MKIVVVGGGIVGLGSAYELALDGHDVTVLDAHTVGAGASHGNAAKITMAEATPVPAPGMVLKGLKWMLKADSPLFVRPSLSPPFLRFMFTMARHCNEGDFRRALKVHLDMASTCAEVLDEWADDGLAFEMHRKGGLLVFENRESFEHRVRLNDAFAPFGLEPELLGADALHDREPCLSDRARHALFFPDERQVEPDSLTGALAKRLREMGAQVREHTNVLDFEQTGSRVTAVITDAGRVECDQLVLATGVWTGLLAAKLGTALPIGPGKGYSVDYFPSPVPLNTPLTFEDAHVAVTPLNGRLRLAGTMEFAGLATDINARRVGAVKRAAARGFRDWDEETPHAEPWAGLRPMTADGLPIVGRLRPDSNVLIASGHGMLGLTLAPSTAKTVRDLARDVVAGRRSPLTPYGPERFLRSPRKKSDA
ncbi:NAD(P)/FAD-dependent oxidoreductase [Pseudonocardia charpentierae]|uniref:FAD-dependent oxidoreductase n=1 Tax=Pseudonocardia charpentierae TaxID=3075545 RepID=A0ABU2NGJ5_9PSEU|nr:FAD-dependent oxidoreductase [Pseudonocardia sp. DSM 45834]MDT0353090.1 FAD-dependent oxidoreductase [Pseudonocardia sp. DSM 45834]